jgi:hypothetical protein
MGGMCICEGRAPDALNSASIFWTKPSRKKLFERQQPGAEQSVEGLKRGRRSYLTSSEYYAAIRIIISYRAYKKRKELNAFEEEDKDITQ